jgi:hypothetical protein
MRRGWLVLGLIGIALPLVFVLPDPRTSHSDTPAPLPATPAFNPFDSIRTNVADYVWPTDAGRIITSTFGEYRRTHFHAGIDISTGDRTGYKVFASRGGSVARVIVDADGYGKALFIRHRDGYTTTYAHLQRFAPRIEARVRAEQKKLERYPVDISSRWDEFPVAQGEVIAYTGDTGSGSPHLHFEIRDENMNAVNPMLCPNLRINDGSPPTIRKVAVIPLGGRSRVDGASEPAVLVPTEKNSASTSLPHPFHLSGSGGIAIYARGRSPETRYTHGVYRHRLFLDGQLLYSVTLDRVPVRETQQIRFYYDRELLAEGQGRFERLFAEGRNGLPFVSPGGPGAGVIDASRLTEGPHLLSVLCEDISGNRSTINGTLFADHSPELSVELDDSQILVKTNRADSVTRVFIEGKNLTEKSWTPLTAGDGFDPASASLSLPRRSISYDFLRTQAENARGSKSRPGFIALRTFPGAAGGMQIEHETLAGMIRLLISTNGAFTSPPTVTVAEGPTTQAVLTEQLDVNRFAGFFTPSGSFSGPRRILVRAGVNGAPTDAATEFALYPIVPGRSGSIQLDGGNLVLRYDANAVYDTIYLECQTTEEEGVRVYTLMPETSVLRDGIEISLRSASAAPHQGLFSRQASSWSLLSGGEKSSGGVFTAMLRRALGDVSVMADDAPPEISAVRITSQPGRTITARFRYYDNLAGVDYHELKTYIDEKFVIPEIDGEHRRALIKPGSPLARGSHRLTIRLKDSLGNTSTLEQPFVVR